MLAFYGGFCRRRAELAWWHRAMSIRSCERGYRSVKRQYHYYFQCLIWNEHYHGGLSNPEFRSQRASEERTNFLNVHFSVLLVCKTLIVCILQNLMIWSLKQLLPLIYFGGSLQLKSTSCQHDILEHSEWTGQLYISDTERSETWRE